MKIFLVERTDNWSYDDYDSFVCYSETPEQAKQVFPSEYYHWKDNNWYMQYADGTWDKKPGTYHGWTSPENITTREIGESLTQEAKAGEVILASFNAG